MMWFACWRLDGWVGRVVPYTLFHTTTTVELCQQFWIFFSPGCVASLLQLYFCHDLYGLIVATLQALSLMCTHHQALLQTCNCHYRIWFILRLPWLPRTLYFYSLDSQLLLLLCLHCYLHHFCYLNCLADYSFYSNLLSLPASPSRLNYYDIITSHYYCHNVILLT